MVSTQTSTNISLLLLKEHTKTFSQTTLERSLMWIIDIHASETVQTVRPNLSIHAQKELAQHRVTVLTEEGTKQSSETSANWHRLH